MQEATLPVGRAPTTTPRPFETSNAHSGMRPLVPGSSRQMSWTAIGCRGRSLPRRLSFSGYSAASIDISDANRVIRTSIQADGVTLIDLAAAASHLSDYLQVSLGKAGQSVGGASEGHGAPSNHARRPAVSMLNGTQCLWPPHPCPRSWRCHQDVLVQMFLYQVAQSRAVDELNPAVLGGLGPTTAREP